MSDEKKQLSKARQTLVDRVLSRLDKGEMPWDNGMQGITAPFNAISYSHYRGINLLNLFLAGKADPRWITFNQAKDNGYTVKKGAKGVPIELYKTIDKRTGKDADFTAIREEVKDMTFAARQEFKKKNLQSFARSYYVFNASDVLGIEPYTPLPVDESARNERIEAVIAASEAPILYDGNGRNYYAPDLDEIHLTDRTAFTSDEFFYNTALHEMAHSTGHGSRLNRPSGHFGSKEYAREELVAEISSVLTAAELGLNHSDRVIENSTEYVRGWAQLIRDNPQTLIDAAFDASHATDYICSRERQAEKAQEEKTQKESHQSNVSPLYKDYTAMQDKYPDAVVVWRLGDFYEVLGDKARTVADEVGLTLTSRDVGLPERVPMCGFPYHATEQYVEKIRRSHDVAIVEGAGQEIYMQSLKTPLEESAQKEKGARETQNIQLRMTAAEATLFNDFLNGWNDDMSDRHEIMDFGANRPTSEDFWKGLEMLGDVERSDMSFGVKFDRTRAHSFSVLNATENAELTEHKAAPTAQQHKKPLVVNFYGGPSSGKTTAALELTAALKKAGYNVEYVPEFAKQLVLEGKPELLKNQQYVTDGQYNLIDRIRGNADVIVTDSPVLLGLVYGKYNGISDDYAKKIRGYYDSFDNFNMFVERPNGAAFQTEGRIHDEQQSVKLDGEIKDMLVAQKVFYGSYKRDDIAKTVERVGQTYNRLYGGASVKKTQKESGVESEHKLKTNLDNIPNAMKALPNWIAFRTRRVYSEKDKEWQLKKIPLTPNQPRPVSSSEYLKWAHSDDPSTWASFEKAAAFARKYKLDGLSFAMGGSGITCIDLDHHLDENGKPSEFSQRFINAAGATYMEKSVSGSGLHIFYAGQMPQGIKNVDKNLDLEVYDGGRFMSMTGNLYGAATKEIKPPSAAMIDLLKTNLHREEHTVLPSKPLGLSDNELIELIRSKSSGRDFEAMWRGEDICGNRNVTDMKLCGLLAFYSNGDVDQVERCFKASGLYRPPPEKSAGYVRRTAAKACAGRKAEYDPKAYAQRMKPNRSVPKSTGKPTGSGGRGSSGR